MLALRKKSYDQPRQHIQKQRHYFANKDPFNQGYGFPSGHVWMWELDCGESWVPKIWCFWTVVLDDTLESPLDCKEIKSVNLKGNQSWIFLGSTDAEAEAPILWPPDGKNWLLGIHPDARKDWRQEEKGVKRIRWLDGITKSVDMSLRKLKRQWRTEKLGVLQSTGSQRVRHDWVTELNWTVSDFIFLGSKITADGDCSYEIKRQLLLGRKVMTNLHSNIKKQRHFFSNKGPSS